MLELAVVAELAGELDQLLVAGDEHAALAGGDGLGRVERVDAGVAEAAGPVAVPVGAVGVGAVLEQEDPVVATVGGDPLGVEGDVAADVDEDRGARLVALGLAPRSPRRTCRGRSRLQSTNSTSAPAPIAASGVAMKVLDGQSTVSPRTPANSSAASAPPAQLERPRLGSPFHSRPALLEGLELRALRPLLGIEHLGPQLEEPGTVTVIEPDRELGRVGPGCLCGPYDGSLDGVAGGCLAGVDRLSPKAAARLAAKPDSSTRSVLRSIVRRGRSRAPRRPPSSPPAGRCRPGRRA